MRATLTKRCLESYTMNASITDIARGNFAKRYK